MECVDDPNQIFYPVSRLYCRCRLIVDRLLAFDALSPTASAFDQRAGGLLVGDPNKTINRGALNGYVFQRYSRNVAINRVSESAIILRKSWYIITVVHSNSGSIHKRPAVCSSAREPKFFILFLFFVFLITE